MRMSYLSPASEGNDDSRGIILAAVQQGLDSGLPTPYIKITVFREKWTFQTPQKRLDTYLFVFNFFTEIVVFSKLKIVFNRIWRKTLFKNFPGFATLPGLLGGPHLH